MSLTERLTQARKDAITLDKIMVVVQSADGSDYHTSAAELDYLWQAGDTIKGIFRPSWQTRFSALPANITSKVTAPKKGALIGRMDDETFSGRVLRCEGNICHIEKHNGETDVFIWRFHNNVNVYHDWIGKPIMS